MPRPSTQYAMTQDEVAAALGLTRGGVLAIETSALKKCRRVCKRHGIRFEDYLNRLSIDVPHCIVALKDQL